MPKRRLNLMIPGMITIIALPAVASFLYFQLTGDPTLQPLSVTKTSLLNYLGIEDNSGITVQIDWGMDANTPNTPAQVRTAIENTLEQFAVDYRVKLQTTKGNQVRIYYLVNASTIGPYPIHLAASGIPAAMAALRMK